MIKKLVYTVGTHDLNLRHNKAMAHMNLYQDKFQDIPISGINTWLCE